MSITSILAAGAFLLGWAGALHAQSPAGTSATWPTLNDLPALRQIDELAVSRDGRWAAYVQAPVFEFADNSPAGLIALVNLRDGRRQRLDLENRPQNLQWSPRGDLAFLMTSGGGPGVWRYSPLEPGTKPRLVVDSDSIRGEIQSFAWSPPGDAIAYLAADPATLKPPADSMRRPERLVLFRDTPGDLTGQTSRLFQRDSAGAYLGVAPLNGQAPRVVRRRVISWKGPAEVEWLATGELGIVGIALNAKLDQLFHERKVAIIDPRSGAARHLALPDDDAPRHPRWSTSGRRLAYLQSRRASSDPRRPSVVYVLRAVDRPATISKVLISHEADGLWIGLPPLWSADERTIYVGRYQRGSARLYAIDLRTRRWQALTPDTLSVSHYALANDGRHLLAVLENANQPRELYRLDPATRALTRLTHEGKALSGLPVGRVDTVQWRSRDGRFTVHGFLVKPASYDPKRRYPLIVAVHGGPGVFYTNSFMGSRFDQHYPPAQLLAASGYLVLLPNPRGDTSYGPEFQAALNRDLASGPFHDVDSGVAALVERGLVDSTSIGLFGVSYGAYLTAYAITQTHRYAAAAIDDGPINLSSLFAHEYAMETMSLRARLGGTPWSHPKLYASQSPITFVDRIKTPVLMRYGGRSVSAADAVRFSVLSQGLEFYAGLKESNVPVEFVLHPDQGHGIADWHLYRDWVDRTLAWFGRWMPRRSNP